MKVPIFGAVVHKGDVEIFRMYLSEGGIWRRDVEIVLGPSQLKFNNEGILWRWNRLSAAENEARSQNRMGFERIPSQICSF